VRSIADLRNRKIRTVQNPVHVATFNAFGANATALAYTEVYSSLQTGVVDGADAANTNYFTEKFYRGRAPLGAGQLALLLQLLR
jgi:TRAP-type transport system periplasmic protein